MKSSFTWNFSNPSDYTYNTSKITFATDINGDDYITLTNPADMTFPYIINATGVYFTFINKITTVETDTVSGAVIRYQLSQNGEDWYFYNTSTALWELTAVTTGTYSEIVSASNSDVELSKAICEKFATQVDSGKLYWKAFLMSDGNNSPRLYSFKFDFEQYYTTIKLIRDLMSPYGLRARDPISGLYCVDTDFLSDDKIRAYIPLADSYINSSCFRDFYYHRDVVEFHDGNNTEGMITYFFPITKISHVIMYNQLLQAMRTFLDFEIIIHPEWGELFLPPAYPAFLSDKPSRAIFGNIFIYGKRNVEIMYDYGYDVPLEDIQQAASKYAGILVLQAYWAWLTRGIQSRSFDGYSESYMQKPFEGITEIWRKEIEMIINTNRKQFQRSI